MLKNEGNLIAEDCAIETVYVPYKFSAATEGNSSMAGTPASWAPSADLEMVEDYFEVVTDTLGEPSGEPDEDGTPTWTENDIIRAILNSEDRVMADIAAEVSTMKYNLSMKELQSSLTATSPWLVRHVPKTLFTYLVKLYEQQIKGLKKSLASAESGQEEVILLKIKALQEEIKKLKQKISDKNE